MNCCSLKMQAHHLQGGVGPSGMHTPGNKSVYCLLCELVYCVTLGKFFNLTQMVRHVPLWHLPSRTRWVNVNGFCLPSTLNSHCKLAQGHKVTSISDSSGKLIAFIWNFSSVFSKGLGLYFLNVL